MESKNARTRKEKMGGKRITILSIGSKLGILAFMTVFVQCASTQTTEKKELVEVKDPYMEKWTSETKEGGSGYMLYFPVANGSNIVLEYAYFKGRKVKLEKKEGETVFVGKYKNFRKTNLVMDADPKKEFGNQLPELPEKMPYTLKGNECVIEYTKDGQKAHIKIKDLFEKES